jgi:hypothetical protein
LKLRIASLLLLTLCLTLAALPAMADTIYSNGPTNGNTDGWNIAFGFIVSDSFNVAQSGSTITGFNFAAWLVPGDTLQTAELSITASENGGQSFYDQVLNFAQSGCVGNSYGYNVCSESATLSGTQPVLNSGSYWINLQNGVTAEGQSVYWDENSGPSSASQSSVGTIPSESFTVLGSTSSTTSTTTTSTTGGTVPEPSSIMLFGSGILGLAGVLRRKLF